MPETVEPSADESPESDVRPAEPSPKFVYSGGSRPVAGYTIKRGIGRGGFGEVYYAISDGGKEVALKLIRRNFDVEVRGVAQCLNLKHPNLVGLYDIRTDDHGDRWVVMEFVSGPSLEDVIAEHPQGLPPAEAVAWLKGIAAGVAYLHECGIVHRDLKPGNIFCDGGLVKIGDYGLSKFISCSRRSGQTESVGTVHYMAPEIASGRYGREIDIYAVSIILHEMLTGRVPFDGESVGEVLMKHLTAQPDLSALAEPYRGVLVRGLAKDAQERFGSVGELIAALGDVPVAAVLTHDLPPVTPPTGIGRAAAPGPRMISPLSAAPAPRSQEAENAPLEEPILRWVRGTLSGFGVAWRERFSTPAKVALIIAALWLLVVHGQRLVPPGILAAVLYGVYYIGWSVHRRSRQQAFARRSKSQFATAAEPAAAVAPPLQSPAMNPTPQAVAPAPRHRRRWHDAALPALVVKPLRLRAAELCGSLVLSSLVVFVMTLVMILIWGEARAPEQFAWIALVSIAGAWGVLVPAKFWEGTHGEPALRRFTLLVVGLALGLVAWGLQRALLVPVPHEFTVKPIFTDGRHLALAPSIADGFQGPALMAYLSYFGFLYLIVRWWRLADPLRGSRLSLWTTAKCVTCALALYMFWPFPQRWQIFPQPWGFWVAAIVAVAVQLASPWAGRNQHATELDPMKRQWVVITAVLVALALVFSIAAWAAAGSEAASDSQAPIATKANRVPKWTEWNAGELRAVNGRTEVMVHAGPHVSRSDCEEELTARLTTAVEEYVTAEIGSLDGRRLDIPLSLIQQQFVADRHETKRLKSFGPLNDQELLDMYALLRFDAAARTKLRDRWREAIVRGRLRTTGAALGVVLATLTLGWAYLHRSTN